MLVFPDASTYLRELLVASTERGTGGGATFRRYEPRASGFLEWCVSEIVGVLALSRQGIFRHSERCLVRAIQLPL